MRQLKKAIGAQTLLTFVLLSHPMTLLPAYEVLRTRWRNGERILSSEVRNGILEGNLVVFGDCQVTAV